MKKIDKLIKKLEKMIAKAEKEMEGAAMGYDEGYVTGKAVGLTEALEVLKETREKMKKETDIEST